MPTPTYIPMATVTLGSSASSVSFSSIPATFRDLVLVVMAYSTSASPLLSMTLNADTGANYSRVFMFGDGSATGSGSFTDRINGAATVGGTQNTFQLMDYSATNKHKTILTRYGSAGEIALAQAMRYASTSAISSVQLTTSSNQFASGSTFNLYGIEA